MAKNKKSKSLLNEATVRRMMKLADIPELSESFFSETGAGRKGSSYGDLGKDPDDPTARDYEETRKGDKTKSGASAYGDYPSKDDEKEGGGRAYMGEADEEEELDATEDELGAEDSIADEEGAELDAEASEGEAEITPEQAAAVVELAPVIADLAASLEAGGAVEGGEVEVEAEVEMTDDGEEVEAEEGIEDLEEQLAKLGIEVVDDHAINEAVRKRVLARLLKEKKTQQRDKTLNTLTDRIFARLRTTSRK